MDFSGKWLSLLMFTLVMIKVNPKIILFSYIAFIVLQCGSIFNENVHKTMVEAVYYQTSHNFTIIEGLLFTTVLLFCGVKTRSKILSYKAKINLMKAEIKQSHKDKYAFYTKFSREIQNPVHSLFNSILLLRENLSDKDLNCENQFLMTVTESCSEIVLSISSMLLDASQLRFSEFKIDPVSYHTSTFLSRLFNFAQSQCNLKELDFLTVTDINIPSEIIVDGEKLNRILIALLFTAIRDTSQGKIAIVSHWHPNKFERPQLEDLSSVSFQNLYKLPANQIKTYLEQLIQNNYSNSTPIEIAKGAECQGNLTIELIDTGSGLKPDDVQQIQNNKTDILEQCFSNELFTLMLCKESTLNLGGEFAIKSCQGLGTSIRLSFPVKYKQTVNTNIENDSGEEPDAEVEEDFDRQEFHSLNERLNSSQGIANKLNCYRHTNDNPNESFANIEKAKKINSENENVVKTSYQSGKLQGMRIFIVGGSNYDQILTKTKIEKNGGYVTTADNYYEMCDHLSLYPTNYFDVVIIDGMSKNGIEEEKTAIKLLRDSEEQHRLRGHAVIMLSHSNINQEQLQELFNPKGVYQISQFICKPCSLETLMRILDQYKNGQIKTIHPNDVSLEPIMQLNEVDSSAEMIEEKSPILIVFTGKQNPQMETELYDMLDKVQANFEVADLTMLEESCKFSKKKNNLSQFSAIVFATEDKLEAKCITLAAKIKLTLGTSSNNAKGTKVCVAIKDFTANAKNYYSMQIFDQIIPQAKFDKWLQDTYNSNSNKISVP
jgi:signal transduction histidine kinase